MPSYVAFLRAINLGAKRKFPKDDIARVVASTGARDVATHINTGNVRLTSGARSREKVEAALESAFAADRGFEVPTIVFATDELRAIVDDIEELHDPALMRHYVLLLKDEPSSEVVATVHALESGPHRAVIRGRAAHLLLGEGYEAGGVDPLKAEKLLGVATNRNHTVLRAIADKWL
ncbi:DUF1697 domain-containing protein [Nocardioides cavernaquae]|uniref:DUF1697 domain-containing protein n=1 Tax=Nocardioides cavernaquae TaxID=2321396 RepID=A0A3A5HCW7_9ACTN|nr:DUF1697 domain-containing protein [Nocardioides cavernaquae]RJS47718.1 DUF1697 domain-containing protein [Nocardioides cavernaquae]